MLELESINNEVIQKSIKDLVPSYQHSILLETLTNSMLSDLDIDRIGLRLTGENRELGFITHTSTPVKTNSSMWSAIKSECFEFLCTDSSKYDSERKKSTITLNDLITLIATSLAAKFNIAAGVITGAITLVLISVVKITKNAWCKMHTNNSL